MRRLAFALSPKKEFVPIGDENTGIIYLQKINGRKAVEREQLDQTDVIKTNAQLLLLKLAKKIAEDKGISTEEALEMVVSNESENEILMSYTDEVERMIELRKQGDSLKNIIATTLIRHRIAYPVIVTGSSTNSDTVDISPLSLSLKANSQISFNGVKMTLSEDAHQFSEILKFTSAVSLTKDTVGFLIDPDTGNEMVGDDLWSELDTSGLADKLVDKINEFYEIESAGGEPSEKKEPSKNRSKSSKNISQET